MFLVRVLGVDPGIYGAVALYDGKNLEVWDMPALTLKRNGKNRNTIQHMELSRIIDRLCLERLDKAFIENVGGMTGQSASAAFVFGHGCGLIKGIIAANFVPIEMVTPQSWRKAMRVNAGKDGSLALARGMFPDHGHYFTLKKYDGRAEAAIIAAYGYRKEREHAKSA